MNDRRMGEISYGGFLFWSDALSVPFWAKIFLQFQKEEIS